MKKNIFIAAIAIAFLAPAQIFAQAQESQTSEQQIQEVISIIKSEIVISHPEYKEATRWDLSSSKEKRESQGVHYGTVISLGENAQYLWFSNNTANVVESVVKDLKFFSQEFGTDLYQLGYVGTGDEIALVLFLDYQNPVTNLEDLQKAALKGIGISPAEIEGIE